jgi:hypothetical protein
MKKTSFARLAVAFLALLMLGTVASGGGGYLQTFDGAPAVPLTFRPSQDFDVVVHVNDGSYTPTLSGHGPACEPPPMGHIVSTFEDSVYNCKGHLMTSLFAPGYGVIYLTPNQMVDFSTGEAVISFDVSTLKTSDRDWIDLWVTPYADHLALPLDPEYPDLNGVPRNGIHIKMDNVSGGTGFRSFVSRNFNITELNSARPWDGYESVLTPSATARTTFELRISKTHVKFGMPAYNFYWLDTDISNLGWANGVVQLGHHSYNPMKNGGGNNPDTWHWDNISVNPATPFTIVEATRRMADPSNPQLSFSAPAPAGGNLRFTGRGNNLKVSFNGGASWQNAGRQAVSKADQEEVFKSYWMPVPAGTTSVKFSGSAWFAGQWEVRDASFFSPAAPAGGVPVVLPTPVPTVAPTLPPVVPSPTVAPIVTVRPSVQPSVSAAPSATPSGVPAAQVGSRISWLGGKWYLHGANIPWYNWGCDFGCGSARGGVSDPASKNVLAPKLAQAKAAGMHALRWWTFEGDPWQIGRDASGAPTTINPAVYADFDAALALAQTNDLYYDFVLFSGPAALPAAWLSDPTQRQKLADALAPLFARYKNNPRVLSWEIFNEPDLDIWNGKAVQSSVQETVRAITQSVHANSTALVTVGTGFLDGLPMWMGLGLDYYQAHWYDFMSSGNYCAICTNYAEVQRRYGLDKPLVIGEFYSDAGSKSVDRLDYWYRSGYAGAWSWSLFTAKTSDGMVIDLGASSTFASTHAQLGPVAGAQPVVTPTPTVAPSTAPSSSPSTAPSTTPTTRPTPKPTVAPTAPPKVNAPSFRSRSTVMNGTTVARPAGTTIGDLLLATLEIDRENVTVKGPAGWTLLLDTPAAAGTSQAFHAQVWYKVAGAGEPASYRWTVPADTYTDIALLAYANVDTSQPIAGAVGRYAGFGTSASTASLAGAPANSTLVAFFSNFAFGTWSAGSGLTERVQFDSNFVADVEQTSAGSTGTKSASNPSRGAMTAQLVALRPRTNATFASIADIPALPLHAVALDKAIEAQAPVRIAPLSTVPTAAAVNGAAATLPAAADTTKSARVAVIPASEQRSLLDNAASAVRAALAAVPAGLDGVRRSLQLFIEDRQGPAKASDFHSAWVNQTPHITLAPNAVSDELSVVVRNSGSRSWVAGREGQQANLGLTRDVDQWAGNGVEWLAADRVATQSSSIVQPGESTSFTFRVHAPDRAGQYFLHLRPVVDGLSWLEDQGVWIRVTVQ